MAKTKKFWMCMSKRELEECIKKSGEIVIMKMSDWGMGKLEDGEYHIHFERSH